MLSENIRKLRKQKGYSQETLAQALCVVRQTVSKWEKGLSVPDADMLERLAETFEVTVGQLLDETVADEPAAESDSSAEIVRQLAILNDHFARQVVRRRRVLRTILWIVAAVFALSLLLAGLFGLRTEAYKGVQAYAEAPFHIAMWCELEGETYFYEIDYDHEFRIHSAGGDSFLVDNLRTEQFSDVQMLLEEVEEYITERGGSVKLAGDVPE